MSGSVRVTGFFSMPEQQVWNRDKNEMEVITLGPCTKFDYGFDFRLFVAVTGIKVMDGKEVVGVVHSVGSKVQSIMKAIEFESRRLGYVK